jgi:hypothetical protein
VAVSYWNKCAGYNAYRSETLRAEKCRAERRMILRREFDTTMKDVPEYFPVRRSPISVVHKYMFKNKYL